VVAAIWRCPENSDWLPAGCQYRINLEHVGDVMLGTRVICSVHSQGDLVMVYRDIWLAVRPGNTGAGAATTRKQVDHQFFLEGQTHAWLAMDELGFLLLCGHRGSSPVWRDSLKWGIDQAAAVAVICAKIALAA
jgi:hypothetical protein